MKRGVCFVRNILPSYATTDADIEHALQASEASLSLCVVAEKAGDVQARLEGKVPITVI